VGGGGDLTQFFHLHISSSWVNIRLNTEIQLPRLPGSGLNCNGTWCGGGGGSSSSSS
jgi:hypothetical protein